MKKTYLVLLTSIVVFFAVPFLVGEEDIHLKPDVAPIPIRTPPPEFPLEMKRNGVSGLVVVTVTINESGSVASAVIKKSTNEAFNDAAMDAVKKWKFKPAKKNDQPISTIVSIPLKFDINE